MIVYDKQIIYAAGTYYVAYKQGAIYKVKKDLTSSSLLCIIPNSRKNRIFCKVPLLARMFRLAPRAVIEVNDSEILFAYLGVIYILNHSIGNLKVEHTFSQPMRAPISFTRVQGLAGFDDMILYGEYHGNTQNGAMSVYGRVNGVWNVVYTFEPRQILHIHGFCIDKVCNRVIILTGDKDNESGLWVTTDNFKTVTPLLTGSQDYRACVAFCTKEGKIIYATDTPLKQNNLYMFNGGHPLPIHQMNGPCIFGVEYQNLYVFATSVEGNSRMNWYRYLLSTKLGPGVHDKYVHIVKGNLETGFEDILTLKKDSLPYLLFEFGNATFCNDNDEHLIINPQSIRGYFQKSIIL